MAASTGVALVLTTCPFMDALTEGEEFTISVPWVSAAGGGVTINLAASYAAQRCVHRGLASAGAAGTITLDTVSYDPASDVDDRYNDDLIYIVKGTGIDQMRTISNYTGATGVADITPNWGTNADSTSKYWIYDLAMPESFGIKPIKIRGYLKQVITNPGAVAPTNLYNVVLADPDGIDLAQGSLLARSNATSELVLIDPVVFVNDEISLQIDTAGASKDGLIKLLFAAY